MIGPRPVVVRRSRNGVVTLVLAALVGLALAPLSPVAVVRAATDVGYVDQSYSGTSTPTGREPQSKLWYNDGTWWGSLYGSASRDFDIHRLDRSTQTWIDTGVMIDDRSKSSADTLWDGSKLFAVSAVSDQSSSSSPPTGGDLGIRVLRYSYSAATKSYSLDAGFPAIVATAAVESVSLDKDSTGRIWVTWTYANGTGRRSVYVTHSTASTSSYIAPYALPVSGATNLDNSDYSAIVAYSGRIGVMWSNQTDAVMYFAYHQDGAPDSAWTVNEALSGPGWADNHMTIKSLQADAAGQVFAATKTSLNGDKCPPSSTNAQKPLILLLYMDTNGGWQRRTFSTAADCESRPILVLDQQSRKIYLFATLPAPGSSYGSGGSIYYKSTSLDNPNFASGPGTPFIQLAAHLKVNNATSTKQSVTPASGLVVLAGDDHTKTYVHNDISLGGDTAAPGVTATDPASGASNIPTASTVSATFSEPIAAATVTTTSFTLTDTTTSTAVSGSVAYDSGTLAATFTPSAALAGGHAFRANVSTAVTDLAGNHLAAPVSWTFTTVAAGDSIPPSVTLTAPATGALVSGGGVSLSATASDNVAVDHVDFLVDGVLVGSDASAPYGLSWDSSSVGDGSHTITARAVDPSLNSASDSHAVTVSNVPPPSGSLFSDDFESGGLSRWSTVSTAGSGSASVQSGTVHDGVYAARLTSSGSGSSYAYARADFGSNQGELTLAGDFRIAGEGASNQNIPLFRLFDASGTRRLSLYRQDVSGGIYIWDGTGYHPTGTSLALNTWGHFELHAIAGNGSGIATLELRLDGALIYQVTNATLPPVRIAQIGNDSKNQPMDLHVDNVAISGPGGAPTAPDTTITSGPIGTVPTSSASFSFTSSTSGASFTCSLDGAPFTACTAPKAYSGLADGPHAFAVAAAANGISDPTPATTGWTVDTAAPGVTSTDPASGASNIPTASTVRATFSEPIAAATVTTTSFTLTDTTTSTAVSGSVAYDSGTLAATFTPSAALAGGHAFRANVSTAVTDLAGNHLAAPVSWTFTTVAAGDSIPPSVTLTAPATGALVSGGGVSLSATASDNVAVDHVDFLVDGVLVGSDASAPYGLSWDSSSVGDGSHTITARAVDPSLNSASDSHAVTVSNVPPPSGSLFSDDFESGGLSRWSTVSTAGSGSASVQSGTVHDGVYAARLTSSGSGSSYAYARADFGSNQGELTLAGDFRIAGEGASNQNIPLFRLFDASGTRRLSLYRQDVSGGIYIWDGTGYHPTGTSLALNTWGHFELHAIAGNGSGIATLELRLDGALIYQVTNATLPPVRIAQIGNDSKNQPMDLHVDNVAISGA